MAKVARAFAFLVLAVVLAGVTLPPARAQSASVTGRWDCLWIEPARGFVYECVMTLVQARANTVEGSITWTLVTSPRPEEQAKLGLTAVEYVRGTFDPATRKVNVEGYDKDDPNTIIGLDGYPLELSASGQWMFGQTHSHGTGNGRFSAVRN